VDKFGKCLLECYDSNCLICTDYTKSGCVSCVEDFNLNDFKTCEDTTGFILMYAFYSLISLIGLIVILTFSLIYGLYRCRNNNNENENNINENENHINVNIDDPKNKVIENFINAQRIKNKIVMIKKSETNENLNELPKENLSDNNNPYKLSIETQNKNNSTKRLTIIDNNNDLNKLPEVIRKNYENLCVICKQNKNVLFKTTCGCYFCSEDKNIITNNQKVITDYKCPKCNVETRFEDKNDETINKLESLNVISCGICYMNNEDLASYHDNCGLRVCRECHFKAMNKSNLCPYCRKQIY